MKTDNLLQKDIVHALTWDSRVNPSMLGVIVNDGRVTLTGWVTDPGEKRFAEHVTRRVEGVTEIENLIELAVIPVEIPAEIIASAQ